MASMTEKLDFPFSLIFVLMVLARTVLDYVSSSIALEPLFSGSWLQSLVL